VNNRQKEVMFKKILTHYKGDLKNKIFGVWGLTFKPNTDDMRESPALKIIEQLIQAGAVVKAYDPVAMPEAKKILGGVIEYGHDMYDVMIDASGLIMATEWSEFRVPNFKLLSRIMKDKIIFDGRNIYDPAEVEENGFAYYGIGRKKTGIQ
jgi:UDPglucose 6-dehydrogenase